MCPVNLEVEILVGSGERMDFPFFFSMGQEVVKQDLGMNISAKPRFRQVCIHQHVRNVNTTAKWGRYPCVRVRLKVAIRYLPTFAGLICNNSTT